MVKIKEKEVFKYKNIFIPVILFFVFVDWLLVKGAACIDAGSSKCSPALIPFLLTLLAVTIFSTLLFYLIYLFANKFTKIFSILTKVVLIVIFVFILYVIYDYMRFL